MLTVYPTYYPQFRCLMSACHHNCCIGWEIDIDADTADYYNNLGGPLADKLKHSVRWDETPYFILDHEERCPFLASNNLCEIIACYGEEALCDICREHPRFYNERPGRVEVGLGLSCEAAARLILCEREPMRLIADGEEFDKDPYVMLRDEILTCLQNRSLPLSQRVQGIFDTYNLSLPKKTMADWARFLLSLERMDEAWTAYLVVLESEGDSVDTSAFEAYLGERKTEYEQLLSYLIYRYLIQADTEEAIRRYLLFSVTVCQLLFVLGAVCYLRDGRFTIENQIELCRLFSAEIEYSDENREAFLAALV